MRIQSGLKSQISNKPIENMKYSNTIDFLPATTELMKRMMQRIMIENKIGA